MSHCQGESHDHDHHDHDHDHDDPERGEEQSLLKYIDIPNVRCLNEVEAESAKKVFKPWNERFDVVKVCGVYLLPFTHAFFVLLSF